MKKITTLLLFSLSAFSLNAQSFIQAYQNRANMVSQSNITANLQDFANLGVKTTGSTANVNAFNWLKNKYLAFGYSANQITEDPFTFSNKSSKNLIITKTGTVYPNKYSTLLTDVDPAEDTDYMPFEEKGEVITGFFEKIRSNFPHTSGDTFANTDPVYIFNVGKAAVGALQHFAVAATTVLGTNETTANSLESIKIYPNPAKDILHIELSKDVKNFQFEITDLLGHVLLKEENKSSINIEGLAAGAYIGNLKTKDHTVVRKILIE